MVMLTTTPLCRSGLVQSLLKQVPITSPISLSVRAWYSPSTGIMYCKYTFGSTLCDIEIAMIWGTSMDYVY